MKKEIGFTLVELMIVIGIIGILSSIALPAYLDYAMATKRATAQSDLMKLSLFFERRYTENNSYLIPNGGTDPVSTAVCATAGGCVADIDPSFSHDNYNYSYVTTPTSTSFSFQATPQGKQANDKCGTMTISETGATTSSGTGTKCWR